MKLKIENFNIFLIFLSIFDFPIFVTVSLLIGFNTSDGSVIYRFLIVLLSITVIIFQIKKIPRLKLNAVTIFFILYTLRITYDLTLRGITTTYIENSKIFLFYFGGIIIPTIAISFMKINFEKLNNLIFRISLIQCFFILVGLYLLYGFDLISLLTDRYLFTSNEINNGSGSPLNPILVSRCGATLFILLLVNILFGKIKLKSLSALIAFVISVSLILLGGSRGPLVSCVILSLISFFLFFKNSNIKNIIFGFLFFLSIFFGFEYLINSYSESINLVSRINESLLSSDQISFGREEHFKSAFKQFINNPILGDKIFDNYSNFYPHNLFLESFMALGLFGGLLFIFIIFRNLVNFQQKKNYINLYVLFSIFLLFVCTSGSIWNSFEFWVILILINNKYLYSYG